MDDFDFDSATAFHKLQKKTFPFFRSNRKYDIERAATFFPLTRHAERPWSLLFASSLTTLVTIFIAI